MSSATNILRCIAKNCMDLTVYLHLRIKSEVRSSTTQPDHIALVNTISHIALVAVAIHELITIRCLSPLIDYVVIECWPATSSITITGILRPRSIFRRNKPPSSGLGA